MNTKLNQMSALVAGLALALGTQAAVVVHPSYDTTGAGPGQNTTRTLDVDSTTEKTINWSDSVRLLTNSTTQTSWGLYGGWSVADAGGTLTSIDVYHQDAAVDALRFQVNFSGASTAVRGERAIALWDSADFFTSDNKWDGSAGSSFSLTGQYNNNTSLRFVIRDGLSNYYVSSLGNDTSGYISSATTTLDGTAAGLQWAQFDPNNFKTFDASEAGLGMSAGAFADMTFDNVTGVGFLWEGFRPTGATGGSLLVNDFQVALVPEPATLGLVSAAGAALLFVRRCFRI